MFFDFVILKARPTGSHSEVYLFVAISLSPFKLTATIAFFDMLVQLNIDPPSNFPPSPQSPPDIVKSFLTDLIPFNSSHESMFSAETRRITACVSFCIIFFAKASPVSKLSNFGSIKVDFKVECSNTEIDMTVFEVKILPSIISPSVVVPISVALGSSS